MGYLANEIRERLRAAQERKYEADIKILAKKGETWAKYCLKAAEKGEMYAEIHLEDKERTAFTRWAKNRELSTDLVASWASLWQRGWTMRVYFPSLDRR